MRKAENMEEILCHPIPNDNGNFGLLLLMPLASIWGHGLATKFLFSSSVVGEVPRSLREIPPAHYVFKIKSFSLLSQMMLDAGHEYFESAIFEASGYKWKLALYPHGCEERNGEGHISLYLVIADRDNLPLGWEVNVNFKMFVFDQMQDKYMTVQGDHMNANGKVRRFYETKTEWGFAQLLPLSTFSDAANGYLINDTCVFGVEVFVVNYTGRGECLNLLEALVTTYTWKIDKFSSLQGEVHYSDVFTIGKRKWKLELYPKGDTRGKDKSMSLFILLDDLETFPSGQETYAKFKLRIKSQYNDQYHEITDTQCFSAAKLSWGRTSFLLLTDLHDASNGFLVNNSLVIEAEVSAISTVKNFSKILNFKETANTSSGGTPKKHPETLERNIPMQVHRTLLVLILVLSTLSLWCMWETWKKEISYGASF